MRRLERLVTCSIFLLFIQYVGFTQESKYVEVRDLETWTSAQANLKLNKKWSLGLEGQLRLDKNSLELKSVFAEFGAEYRVSKHIDLAGGIRYSIKNDNSGNIQGIDHYLRYQFDAKFGHKLGRFQLKYRLRYTNSDELGLSIPAGDVHTQYFRLKTAIDYNIKNWKLDPELAGELFTKYEKAGKNNGFDSYRLTAGTRRKIKKVGVIGLYYRLEREIESYYPKMTNIILLKYAYTFKL